MSKNDDRQPLRWCALKVRIDCPECGSALFVDGPYKNVLCSACGARTSVTNLWPTLLENCLERGAGGQHFRASSFVWAGNNVPHILYAANKGHPPLCERCDRVLDEAEHIADGTDGNFFCPACGSPHATWPAPGYLSQKKLSGGVRATQVFMAPPEAAQGQPSPASADARPVIFGCPNCGANLRITGDSPRVLTCAHCDADAYLPPEVWNRLHPVRKRRAFWLRLG
jgi:predicted RNA-binding Zn-ribbon protein involved in translation (DUF1610 family)